MKYLEVRQKYSAARRIFNSLLSVSSLTKHCISCLLYARHTIGFYRSFTYKITECCLLLLPEGKFDLTGSEEVLLYSDYHTNTRPQRVFPSVQTFSLVDVNQPLPRFSRVGHENILSPFLEHSEEK